MELVDIFRNFFGKWEYTKPFIKILPPAPPRENAVTPDNTPLYKRRKWVQQDQTFHGYYRTRYGAWRGEIIRRGDVFKVFIFKPPLRQLQEHSRWVCIHHITGDQWKIDLAINPKDSDIGAIIFFVEKMIIESFEAK